VGRLGASCTTSAVPWIETWFFPLLVTRSRGSSRESPHDP